MPHRHGGNISRLTFKDLAFYWHLTSGDGSTDSAFIVKCPFWSKFNNTKKFERPFQSKTDTVIRVIFKIKLVITDLHNTETHVVFLFFFNIRNFSKIYFQLLLYVNKIKFTNFMT